MPAGMQGASALRRAAVVQTWAMPRRRRSQPQRAITVCIEPPGERQLPFVTSDDPSAAMLRRYSPRKLLTVAFRSYPTAAVILELTADRADPARASSSALGPVRHQATLRLAAPMALLGNPHHVAQADGALPLDTEFSGEQHQTANRHRQRMMCHHGVDPDNPPLYNVGAQSSGANTWLSNRVNRHNFV